jgi:hypothetical protein
VLQALDDGDVRPISSVGALLQGGSEEATFWSVLCADGFPALDDAQTIDLYAQAIAVAPLIGRVPGGIFCEDYPGQVDPLPTLDTTGTPTLLVVANTGDNATPYADGVRLDQLLANSVLVTYDGSGHTITWRDDCVNQIVDAYFVDLTTPQPGIRCGIPPGLMGVSLEPVDNGLVVRDVTDGSAAQAAGVSVDDVVTSFDGISAVTDGIPRLLPDVPVTLGIDRAGTSLEITVTPRSSADGWRVPVIN